jgi:putative glycosyltransferase (TIGR04372 family)
MPYICIHVRDSGYFSAVGAEGLARDATRNADIGSYSEAITYLLDEGYAVVRLGSRVTEPLPIQHPNLWDYANDGSRTELLDLVLPAHCSFFISTLSGPDKIAQAFRRPILFTNLAPLKSCSLWMRDSLIAPKRLVDSAGSRIPWEEVFTTDLYMMNSGELASHGIKLQPNTRSELRSATEEMLQQFVGIEDACSELDVGWQNVLMTIPSYLKAGGVRARFARALLSS